MKTRLHRAPRSPARKTGTPEQAPARIGRGHHRLLGVRLHGERSLPDSLRATMGTALGISLDPVRVREDSGLDRRGLRAEAFGDRISFAPGQYDPQSTLGRELIGHEVAHLAQQQHGGAGPGHEAEADRVGARIASGLPAAVDPGAATSAAPSPQGNGKQLRDMGGGKYRDPASGREYRKVGTSAGGVIQVSPTGNYVPGSSTAPLVDVEIQEEAPNLDEMRAAGARGTYSASTTTVGDEPSTYLPLGEFSRGPRKGQRKGALKSGKKVVPRVVPRDPLTAPGAVDHHTETGLRKSEARSVQETKAINALRHGERVTLSDAITKSSCEGCTDEAVQRERDFRRKASLAGVTRAALKKRYDRVDLEGGAYTGETAKRRRQLRDRRERAGIRVQAYDLPKGTKRGRAAMLAAKEGEAHRIHRLTRARTVPADLSELAKEGAAKTQFEHAIDPNDSDSSSEEEEELSE